MLIGVHQGTGTARELTTRIPGRADPQSGSAMLAQHSAESKSGRGPFVGDARRLTSWLS